MGEMNARRRDPDGKLNRSTVKFPLKDSFAENQRVKFSVKKLAPESGGAWFHRIGDPMSSHGISQRNPMKPGAHRHEYP
jgi:hypothetical protein